MALEVASAPGKNQSIINNIYINLKIYFQCDEIVTSLKVNISRYFLFI